MTAWNAESILTTARCYWECRVLLSAAELDLFARLKDGPRTAAELAEALHVVPRGLTILLDAVTGMGLLAKRDGRYTCPADIAKLLAGSGPGSVLPMVLHSAFQWRRWSNLTDIVRGDVEPGQQPRSPESLKAFIEAMDVVSAPRAAAAVQAVQPGSAKRLIDVGGGPGTYTAAFLRAYPNLSATLFDQPDVIAIARERLKATGLLERVTLVGGNFDVDELPSGHDLAWVSAIIHQNSPTENVSLYRKVFRALAPGGRIVVRDHVMEAERTQPRSGAIFAINMLVSTAGGNCYTHEEIRDDLESAGFARVKQVVKDEMMSGLVEAFKPQGDTARHRVGRGHRPDARISGQRWKPRIPSHIEFGCGMSTLFGGIMKSALAAYALGLATATLSASADDYNPWKEPATYELTYRVDLSQWAAAPAGQIRVWIPLPAENDHQKVLADSIESPWPVRKTTDANGNRFAYVEPGGSTPPTAEVVCLYKVERLPYSIISKSDVKKNTPLDPARYLDPNRYVPIDGEIAELAAKAAAGKQTDAEKIRAYYDYATATMRYSKEGEGWGRGDARWACDSKYGNCTDFHSVIAAMARSQKIPARFMIGFPLAADKAEGTVAGYHCWAEAYDAARGWAPMDASEAWKAKRFDDYFGTLPSDRVEFTLGRDLTLSPPQQAEPLNFIVYPYAESNGESVGKVPWKLEYKRVKP